MPQPATEASASTRFKVWFEGMPFVTRWTMALCVGIYVVGVLIGQNSGMFCMQSMMVFHYLQVYRLLTSVFLHGGVLHILFNMMAFIPMGSGLERLVGSFNFFYLILIFALVSNLLNLTISLLALNVARYPRFAMECGIGFSGVLFGLIVIQTHLSNAETQSIFGFFRVPTKYYPWILLVMLQVIMPNVSFMGHLCGILVGYMYCRGLLNAILLSPERIAWCESKWPVSSLTRQSAYITGSSYSLPAPATSSAPAGGASAASSSSSMLSRAFGSGSASSSAASSSAGGGSAGQGTAFPGAGQALGSRDAAPAKPPSKPPGTYAAMPPVKPPSAKPHGSQPHQTTGQFHPAWMPQLHKLMDMGFAPPLCKRALIESDGNLDNALQYCTAMEQA